MFRVLNRLTIVQTTVSSLIIFAASILVLAALALSSSLNSWQSGEIDGRMLHLLDALEKVAHNHAVERGLTAGYLGAPSDAGKKRLDEQRKKADQSVQNLRKLVSEPWPDDIDLNSHISLLNNHLSNKQQTRRAVDQQSAPGAFAYYSLLNKYALDIMQLLRTDIRDVRLQHTLSSALNLAWFKERAGQARGKINGVFARKNLGPAAKAEISTYITEMNASQQYIENLLIGDDLAAFKKIFSDPGSQRIAQLHGKVLANQPFAAADMPSPQEWFGLATAQIGAVKKVLDKQWEQGHAHASSVKANGATLFWVELVVISVVLLVLGVLNMHLVNALRNKLAKLTGMLRKVADHGDLTIDVRLRGDDELGEVSRAIHETIYAFRDLIVGLATSIRSSSRLSTDLNTVSNKVLKDAETTQQMATSIAASVEEMSTTSGDIAKSASQTLEASDSMLEQAERSITISHQTTQAMNDLTKNMNEVESKAGLMEEQVGAITGILETINTLAEQTNLLALNAAIEAARAGEAGRGFAVVADEVRNLAKGSKESSDKIANLLADLQAASNQVFDAIKQNANSAKDTFDQAQAVHEVSTTLKQQAGVVESLSTQVATAAEEQSVTSKQIAGDTNKVLDAANDELAAAQEMYAIFNDMEANGETLQRTMDGFKIE